MVTIQKYLNEKYPTQEIKENMREIIIDWRNPLKEIDGGELDLREYSNLEKMVINGWILKTPLTKLELGEKPKLNHLNCSGNQLIYLDASHCLNLNHLNCSGNQITSIDFLKNIPYPKKLKELEIFDNNIQTTDIAVFKPFINLEILKIGTTEKGFREGKHNKFFGSFHPWQWLTELTTICIEVTDVNGGLEYLPISLIKAISGGKHFRIECSPHDTNSKCSVIQDELRLFSYNLQAWRNDNINLVKKAQTVMELEKLVNIINIISSKKINNKRANLTLEVVAFEIQEQVNKLKKDSQQEWETKMISNNKRNLENLITKIRNKLDNNSQELLDNLLKSQRELVQNNNSFDQKQLEKAKQRLLNSSEWPIEQELNKLCWLQEKVTKSEIELERIMEVHIETLPNRVD